MNDDLKKPSFSLFVIISLLVLLALGALPSGILMILAPDGRLMHMPVSMLQHSPFHDYFIPGMLLLTFLGIYPLLVAWCLRKRPSWRWPDKINPFKHLHWCWAASLAAGLIVIIWITVQVLMIRAVVFLHVLYFSWGAVLLLLTLLPDIRRYCLRNA